MQNHVRAYGAVASQITRGKQNEANVLLALGKFGWLSQNQLATFCNTSVQTMRHVLRRMVTDKLIWSETYTNSPAVKAFALTRKGASTLKDDVRSDSLEKITTFYTSSGFLSNFEHQYHRHLANEFLIALQSEQIEIGSHVVSYLKSEHEIQSMKNTANTIFQCVPDGLALTTDMTLLIVEIENSSRGISQHSGSMTTWLEVYAENYQRDGYYADSLRTLFKELMITEADGNTIYPDFENVEQVFVCRSERIFRNIWRKVDRATTNFSDVRENISYVVLPDKQRWHNIFDGIEPLFHEEPETIELVKHGSDRYKYTLNKRIQIVNEVDDSDDSRSEVAKRNNISVSTLARWKRGLNKNAPNRP